MIRWRYGRWMACCLAGLTILAGLATISRSVVPLSGTSIPAAGAASSTTELTTVPSCEYWVAPPPFGKDANPGTYARPWATLDHAASSVPDNHCIVWFRDGVYSGNHRLNRRFKTSTTFKSATPYLAILENRGLVVAISGAKNITLEGFRFRHSGPAKRQYVVAVDQSSDGLAEAIALRNNIFHDSYGDDLLKIRDGSRSVTVEGNVFYNQGKDEQHIDVNSVKDVVIRDNIFFNDFVGSGRPLRDTKHFIVIKDSSGDSDGLLGSERVVVQRNVFLSWQGTPEETFVQVGNDGKPYYEAKDVRVENNLIIGSSSYPARAVFGVTGARDVVFANNTIAGDLPSAGYALRVSTEGHNPPNQSIYLYNNVWSDTTGTMDDFSDGDPTTTENLVLDNNLYWNGEKAIPSGDVVSPLVDDARRTVADPRLPPITDSTVLPRWNGTAFASGSTSIRQEFLRLVQLYGATPANSPTVGNADPRFSPAEDILGCPRGNHPDLGAYQAKPSYLDSQHADCTGENPR